MTRRPAGATQPKWEPRKGDIQTVGAAGNLKRPLASSCHTSESEALHAKCHLSLGGDSVFWGARCLPDPRAPALETLTKNTLATLGTLQMALKKPREGQRTHRPLRRRPRQRVSAPDSLACHRSGRGGTLELGAHGESGGPSLRSSERWVCGPWALRPGSGTLAEQTAGRDGKTHGRDAGSPPPGSHF